MSDEPAFLDLMQRVRAGEPAAAQELVRRYEPVLRRMVRVRLVDARLRRLLSASDICQSVLASFFVRAAAGQFDLRQPRQLAGLLVGMAQNKLACAARKQRARRRDARRLAGGPVEEMGLADPGPSPSRVAAGRELLEEVRRRLSEEERRLADRRGQGLGWAEIAQELGGSPDGRRMQLTRALDRVTRELGLDEVGDE